ncbi:transcription factor bHLH117 [Salvia hispanica]|uniref:transcription factor bHLH117 n=1 Tax=Salvia hispanica TaxID=49212 RepID=UPI002009514D|nr:transcription factor bHLH117 [Salvia hispanica]
MESEFPFLQPFPISHEASTDDAYFTGIYAGLSFRSLLTGGSFEPAAEAEDPLETQPFFPTGDGAAPLYNFISETAPFPLHHQLPGLLSYELPQNAVEINSPAPNPRSEADPKEKRPRRRQGRLSDKTQCLRKLLPGDEKMDMATVLEEAYKYIVFLQSQVRALQSMPCQSGAGGDLYELNRQQLLQVATNSPAVQAKLCAEGCCVYAAEQLHLVEKIADRKAMIDQQMMYGSHSNPNFFHA